MRRLLLLLGASALLSCAQPSFLLAGTSSQGVTTLRGWARVRGELDLFKTRAPKGAPAAGNCISGVFEHHRPELIKRFDGKYVEVTGKLYEYESLPFEETPILPRRMLGDSVIPNFCFGDHVIAIKKVRELR